MLTSMSRDTSVHVLRSEPPYIDDPSTYNAESVVRWLVGATEENTMPWPGVFIDVKNDDGAPAPKAFEKALDAAGVKFAKNAIAFRYRVLMDRSREELNAKIREQQLARKQEAQEARGGLAREREAPGYDPVAAAKEARRVKRPR